MFQCKIDEIFSDMPNIFGIADEILDITYNDNGTAHDAMVHRCFKNAKRSN